MHLHTGPRNSGDLPQVSKEEASSIYELMRKIDKVFTDHNITYWATGGTLIGAIRYQGLMPWDDDLDICILDTDEKKLHEAKKDLDALGLMLHNGWAYKTDLYKIFAQDSARIKDANNPESFLPYNFPAIDVFVMSLEQGKEYQDMYVHKSHYFYWHYGSADHFTYDQIKNITCVPFGPLMMLIPEDAELFLNNNYGTPEYPDLWKNYSKEGSWDHKLGIPTARTGASFVVVDDFSSASYN